MLFVHCAAHSLNLAVSSSSNFKPTYSELFKPNLIVLFFFQYIKRNDVLEVCIKNSDTDVKEKTLKRLCFTSYVQKYDAVHDFVELFELFESVMEALVIISHWKDSSGSATDDSLYIKTIDSEFITVHMYFKL